MNSLSRETSSGSPRAFAFLGVLVAAYIGVYLCRKNLAVAVPLLQSEWGLTKAQVGIVGSVSTLAYACGKIGFGPLTDRVGGRLALLGSMLLVALFGAAGALAPSLGVLTLLYSANRLTGAASWGAMVKLLPDWFPSSRLAYACGLLSLSFVFGGAIAVAFAGLIAQWSHDSWSAVLGMPSLVLLLLAVLVWLVLPGQAGAASASAPGQTTRALRLRELPRLFRERTFLVVLGLSFALNLLRETFNFWTVDFIRTQGGSQVSSAAAALLSTPFDLCGAAGIVLMGWLYGHLSRSARQGMVAGVLVALAALLWVFPRFFDAGLGPLAIGIGLIGFLTYGPYSLLAGVLAIETRGQESAATVAGFVDGVGYLAGLLSGVVFGKLLTLGGYRLGFEAMAAVTLGSAALCLFLYPKPARPPQTIRLEPDPQPL